MKIKSKKKGFTLVELLVVIAILAILAAVSVVGYLSFTEKAKESNDESLVSQLNTVLQGNEAVDGKPKTMHEALLQVEEAGFNVEKLTPTSSKNEFLWNQETNRFEIAKVDTLGTGEANPDLWVIVDTKEDLTKYTEKYSVYLSSTFTTTETTVNIKNGFDAGDNTSVETVNLKTEVNDTFTVRTNNGDLTVKAENATVNHYGELNSADITAVANHSYHEYGNVDTNLTLQSGRVSISNKANVFNIELIGEQTKELVLENGSSISGEIYAENATIVIENNVNVAAQVIVKGNSNVENNSDVSIVADESVNVSGSNSEKFTFITVTNKNDLITAFASKEAYIILDSDIEFDLNDYKSDLRDGEKGYLYNIYDDSKIYLDLNGHHIKDPEYDNFGYDEGNINNGRYLVVTFGSLYLTDTSESQTGTIYGTRNLLRSLGNESLKTSTTIIGGTYITKSYTGGTCLYINSTNIYVDSCHVYSTNYGLNIGEFGRTEKAVINGGTIVGTANNATKVKGKYAYAVGITCPTEINNLTVYGIQGALYVGNTGIEINGGYYEASGKAYDLYYEGTGFDAKSEYYDDTKEVTDGMVWYAAYIAGEDFVTGVVINDGTFISSARNALLLGNSNDGGEGLVARAVINSGSFTGKGSAIRVSNEGTDGYGKGIITIKGGDYSHDITEYMNDTENYVCVASGDRFIVVEK